VAAVVQEDAVTELPPGVEARTRPVASGLRRLVAGLAPAGPADLVHALDVVVPARPGAPVVVTVHDLSMFDVPWAFPRRTALGRRQVVRRAVRVADELVAVSAFTAERLRARFGRDATVTGLGVSPGFLPASAEDREAVRRRYGLPDPCVLYLGAVEPRKDLGALARVCADLVVPLVMAGPVLAPAARPAGVLHVGYVPAEDLPALYGAATVVAYPSRYEGFGLPPLEAMASGAAVVATAVGALPEHARDGAALVPPEDPDALRSAIADLLADADRRRELAVAGVAAARRLSWSATAARTLDVYARLGVVPA
jgi:glycosyltransferase involved in cell wall biosynthesis